MTFNSEVMLKDALSEICRLYGVIDNAIAMCGADMPDISEAELHVRNMQKYLARMRHPERSE